MAKAKKTTVVFLHGVGGSKADFTELAKELKGVETLALDFPRDLDGGYEPAALASWLLETLDDEGLDDVVLVGHSVGARLAGEVAVAAPARVPGLVLISPVGAMRYSLLATLKWKGMSRQSVLTSVSETTIRNASSYGFRVDGPGKKGFVERAVASRTGAEGAGVARAVEKIVDGVLGAAPLSERLKGTTMPVMIIAGAHDPLAPPEESKAILKARPDARFEFLPGSGHYPMLEEPKVVAKLIAGLVKEI